MKTSHSTGAVVDAADLTNLYTFCKRRKSWNVVLLSMVAHVCAIFMAMFIGLIGGILCSEKIMEPIHNEISETSENPHVVVNVIVEPNAVSVESDSDKVRMNEIRRSYNEEYKKTSDTKIKVWSWNGGSSIKSEQLRQTIEAVQERMSIVPSHDNGTIDLLMETAATESHRGKFVKQINGPARGVFQMEPATEKDLLSWLKKNHRSIYSEVMFFYNKKMSAEQNLANNVPYQIALTTAHYWRYYGDELVKYSSEIEYRACIWKSRYNTRLGKGNVAKYLCDAEDYL